VLADVFQSLHSVELTVPVRFTNEYIMSLLNPKSVTLHERGKTLHYVDKFKYVWVCL